LGFRRVPTEGEEDPARGPTRRPTCEGMRVPTRSRRPFFVRVRSYPLYGIPTKNPLRTLNPTLQYPLVFTVQAEGNVLLRNQQRPPVRRRLAGRSSPPARQGQLHARRVWFGCLIGLDCWTLRASYARRGGRGGSEWRGGRGVVAPARARGSCTHSLARFFRVLGF
jgi:hypothetical protein